MKINRTHVSGHASGAHLKEFVEEVNAKTLFLFTLRNAKTFADWGRNVKLLRQVGDSFTFELIIPQVFTVLILF